MTQSFSWWGRKRVGSAKFTCMRKSKRMAVPAYIQKYSTAGRDVALPSMKAKKLVIEVSERKKKERRTRPAGRRMRAVSGEPSYKRRGALQQGALSPQRGRHDMGTPGCVALREYGRVTRAGQGVTKQPNDASKLHTVVKFCPHGSVYSRTQLWGSSVSYLESYLASGCATSAERKRSPKTLAWKTTIRLLRGESIVARLLCAHR